MRSSLRWSMAAVLVAGLFGVAVAQQRGGGGMMGGFGGPAALVRSKTVQADIKATDEQVAKLTEWAKESGGKMREKLKDVPREEMREKMAALTAESYKELADVLKPEQVKRLKEIDVQVSGVMALGREDVQSALKITDDQKDKLKAAGMESFEAMKQLREEYGVKGFPPPKLDADKQKEMDKKLAVLQREAMTKVESQLTDDQKKAWKGLTGEAFDVQKYRDEQRAMFGQGGGFRGKKKNNDGDKNEKSDK